MGKLVLFLEDGSAQPVPLDKERVVIGRRVDNDVCLPYPAVSSEHAAIVTILADSFLEDLNSTNGTLVNGKPVTKHFLRDRDEIDIGRQRLVYIADDASIIEARPVEVTRERIGRLADRVDRVEPALRERRSLNGGKPPATGERRGSAEVVPTTPSPAKPKLPGKLPESSASGGGSVDTFVDELVRMTQLPVAGPVSGAVAPARVVVLTGPNAGRSVAVGKGEVVVGRVGLGVAIIRRTVDGYRVLAAQGEIAPTMLGATVPEDGALLRGGETFEVAGTRLEFMVAVGDRLVP
jgi:hypothetical protein